MTFVVAGFVGGVEQQFLLAVIALAALGTAVLFGLSLMVLNRRREPTYLMVSLALGALVFRSVVGYGTVAGVVPMVYHHLLEHALDFLVAVLVLAAVYVRSSGYEQPGGRG